VRRKKIKIASEIQPSDGLEVGCSVDWLAFTIKKTDRLPAFNFIAAFDDLGDRKEVKSMHGYNRAFRWAFGALMLWHDSKQHMGVHFILSGSCLRFLHEKGYDGMFLIQRATACFAKVTMIHFAMDVINGSFTPIQMYSLFMEKSYNGTAQTASIIQNSFGGQTCYVGSWQSQRFYRFYDKAAEQSIEGFNWKRIELVLKGDYAQEFAYKFASDANLNKAVEIFRGTVKKMANFNQNDWLAALEGQVDTLLLPKHKERKTREWLLAQVAPALARYVLETGDEQILSDFSNEFEGIYKKLTSEIE
jgi:hypothetical protein